MIFGLLLVIGGIIAIGYFFFSIPLLPLIAVTAVVGCLVAFTAFGKTAKDTEEKVNRLVKKKRL